MCPLSRWLSWGKAEVARPSQIGRSWTQSGHEPTLYLLVSDTVSCSLRRAYSSEEPHRSCSRLIGLMMCADGSPFFEELSHHDESASEERFLLVATLIE